MYIYIFCLRKNKEYYIIDFHWPSRLPQAWATLFILLWPPRAYLGFPSPVPGLPQPRPRAPRAPLSPPRELSKFKNHVFCFFCFFVFCFFPILFAFGLLGFPRPGQPFLVFLGLPGPPQAFSALSRGPSRLLQAWAGLPAIPSLHLAYHCRTKETD